MIAGIPDVIICLNFTDNRQRGYMQLGVKFSHFCHCPYNNLELPCECVIAGGGWSGLVIFCCILRPSAAADRRLFCHRFVVRRGGINRTKNPTVAEKPRERAVS